MVYLKPIEHKKKRLPLDRRLGRDDTRLTEDINIYRWFCVFIKCALELEGKTFKIRGKNYKVKFNRNHKWWKDINLKSFPKRPKFIRFDYYKLQADIKRLSDPFIAKHKHLFVEKSTFIVLGNRNEQLMRRLFHTLSISQHWGHFQGRKFKNTYTSLDVYFNVQKRMDKSFVIPKIQRVNATGAIGSRTTTTRGKYESKIRMTQRDIRWSKILIINLCNGVFPKIDKINEKRL